MFLFSSASCFIYLNPEILQALEEITFNFIQHQNCIAARRVIEAPQCSQRGRRVRVVS